ncbi:large conductance mechanosensitive channel protein MscL [Serratia proteamaculans]|uniref:hypothetical protein n=1 Tax=Serratia proteamaculans TaxID=28151 RepID=UPI00217BC38D|nr:hypothetical protein [Serratia proteamaculans]CAI1171671.1 Uncharacterised protein [Serratia proteamaculans]
MEPLAGSPYQVILAVIELILFMFVVWVVVKSATKTKEQMTLLKEIRDVLKKLESKNNDK